MVCRLSGVSNQCVLVMETAYAVASYCFLNKFSVACQLVVRVTCLCVKVVIQPAWFVCETGFVQIKVKIFKA